MPMEFTQIIGLTDISHIYSYNYDFNLMKKITLNDLFKQDIDFEKNYRKLCNGRDLWDIR